MPQLIGYPCSLCQEKIDDARSVTTCTSCGHPVHRLCVGTRSVAPAPGRFCSLCGSERSSEFFAPEHAKAARAVPGASRHGCVTVYLFVVIAGNALFSMVILLQLAAGSGPLALPVSALLAFWPLSVLTAAFAVALLSGRMIGFYGILATIFMGAAVHAFVLRDPMVLASAVVAALVLFGVLQIGGYWARLR